jgi:NAD(P)-dependent dehydrogenase (short-subunit alcohol dehydrogenase family)
VSLTGKVAVVTGGSKGIGFGIAEALVKEGASVMICGRDEHDLRKSIDALAQQGAADGVTCDVANEDQVKEVLDACVEKFGGLDILINNAGVGFFGTTVEEMSSDQFRVTLETNLFGVFYACHHAIPLLRNRGGGYIFNISSLAGQNPHARMAAYNASKFALKGFSEAMMQEVRHDGIKVSYICPGSVNTSFGGDEPDPSKAWQLQPDDIARVVVDLLNFDPRALPSKVEIRPSRPPK